MAKAKNSAMKRVAEGIYKRGDAYLVPIYHAELNGGKGGKRWHSATNCTQACKHERIVDLASAKQAKRQLEEQKRARRGGRTDRTVWEWAGSEGRDDTPMWLERYPRTERSTNVHNTNQVRKFATEFRDRTLRSLTDDEMWEFAANQPSAVKEIRACLNDAIKHKLLEINPLEHYDLGQRPGRSDIETLTVEELDSKLLPIARKEWGDYGDEMEALVELGAWTGMRPGELFLLSTEPANDLNGGRVNFIDFDRGLIDVQWAFQSKLGEITRPKWRSMREIVLLPRARAALARLQPTPEGWVFVTQRKKQFTQRALFYYWDPVRRAFQNQLPASHWLSLRLAEQGLKGNLDFYELRHYFGTALAHPPAGIRPASPYEIAQQMGHKDGGALAMRTYIHTKGLEVVKDLNEAWASHAPRARASA